MAFVGIYLHNKDLVGDTRAGCVYIKEASQHRAAQRSNASGHAAAAAVWRQSWEKVDLIVCFFLGKGRQSQGCVCVISVGTLNSSWDHASVCFMLCTCRCKVS